MSSGLRFLLSQNAVYEDLKLKASQQTFFQSLGRLSKDTQQMSLSIRKNRYLFRIYLHESM